jgi:hypothetical protein
MIGLYRTAYSYCDKYLACDHFIEATARQRHFRFVLAGVRHTNRLTVGFLLLVDDNNQPAIRPVRWGWRVSARNEDRISLCRRIT